MDIWNVLSDIVLLLSVALVLGMLFERLRQSAVTGYPHKRSLPRSEWDSDSS